jgi:hypothetical protein
LSGLRSQNLCKHSAEISADRETLVPWILQKLGLRDRVQVVIYAYESSLLSPGAT